MDKMRAVIVGVVVICLVVSISVALIREAERRKEANKEEIGRLIAEGYDYLNRGEYTKAAESFNKALEIDPRDPRNLDAWIDMGAAYFHRGEILAALDCYNKALEIDPDNAGLWVRKGAIYDVMGEFEKAIECYDKALEMYPNHETARFLRDNAIKALDEKKG